MLWVFIPIIYDQYTYLAMAVTCLVARPCVLLPLLLQVSAEKPPRLAGMRRCTGEAKRTTARRQEKEHRKSEVPAGNIDPKELNIKALIIRIGFWGFHDPPSTSLWTSP